MAGLMSQSSFRSAILLLQYLNSVGHRIRVEPEIRGIFGINTGNWLSTAQPHLSSAETPFQELTRFPSFGLAALNIA